MRSASTGAGAPATRGPAVSRPPRSSTQPYPGDLLERRPGSSWFRAETRRWRRQVQAGILRTVAWWALFTRMSVRDWLIFAEKFGSVPF